MASTKVTVFFRSGHVQAIEFNEMSEYPTLCYVRATVLPSMRMDRVYTVRLCCRYDQGNSSYVPTVHVANCVCPAGLAGSCNHVAALLYALEDFVRLGLREEAALTCTQKLAQ